MQKFSLFLLLCGLVLCLAACGPKETTPDDDIVGDDWRTWGTIQDTGTLTRGGDSTDVCICVSDDGAKLYYDLPEQELYGSVVFPESIDGAAGCYQDTDFTDLDGDGNSDMPDAHCRRRPAGRSGARRCRNTRWRWRHPQWWTRRCRDISLRK